ncbi:MAG TPA: DNA repair protein RecN [Thermoanaerobaculaceae bacterium]|nr:DNA repair protein RecN [Thermoanaerobaculaceae bacterium]
MLRELEVRDLGIIEKVRLELPAGFIVLTGETGAGKSLLVQSLQLLAGERADADQVRGGCERLIVEGCFLTPPDEGALTLLGDLGVEAGEELVLRREVSATGRSRAWANDVPVTVGALQRLAPYLLAIHGQHEQRGLTDPATHIALVDAAGGLAPARDGVAAAYSLWQEVRERLDAQRRALANRRDRLDVIAFQLREIDEARPELGEEEALREERAFLQHAERIGELVAGALSALGGESGAVALARAARSVRELHSLGIGVGETASDLEQAQVLAEEAERAVQELADRVRPDPARLEHVEGRLALLERLARKYGGSVAAVLEHRTQLGAERGQLEGVEDDIARLDEEQKRLAARYLELAQALSKERAAAAERFSGKVVAVLKGLGIPRARLRLALGPRLSATGILEVGGARIEPAADGIDAGEFELSTNPGEALRSMARIASGGELSRIHLAMRTVLRDSVPRRGVLTLLFDEVDAGIGGTVADELGALLAALGSRDQVMVVTHLPQVAGRASAHLVVSKEGSRGRTVTHVKPVAGDARVEELVRMLGGGEPTAAARQHARELLKTS